MKTKELMKKNYISVREDETLHNTLKIMNEKKVNNVLVVDSDSNLEGIIVKADVYRFLVENGHYDTYPVKIVMTSNVIVSTQDEEIEKSALRLRENNIMAIPVVDGKKILGLIDLETVVDYFLKNSNIDK
ncbi:MAG: CBS domain-containing protein [Clostridium sp.]|nr:CBS domain-containing protein [Clostridium sp.]